MTIFTCTVFGRPYVKKNNQRAYGSGRMKRIVYSLEYLAWEQRAILAVKKAAWDIQEIDYPVNMQAKFYFKNRQAEPDLSALYEGIQDVLEKCGVIKNDKLIVSHDGSGKFFGEEPRVEVELTKKGEL